MDLMCVLESIAAIESKSAVTTERALTAVSRKRYVDRERKEVRSAHHGSEILIRSLCASFAHFVSCRDMT